MSGYYEINKKMEQLYINDIQFDEQGNIIFNELEQKQRDSKDWQDLEKEYGINFGDAVQIDDYLGRVQKLSVSEESKYSDGLTSESVTIRLYGGSKIEDLRCAEYGETAKEFLKAIKREKKLSITEKIKNTIKAKVQTLKKGGAAQRLANRRTHEKATNAQTKPSASQSASQRLKNKRALQNTQGLER
jgi:hypothetical protein